MADGGYIREYLVGLGFEVDERGLDAFRAALENAKTAAQGLEKIEIPALSAQGARESGGAFAAALRMLMAQSARVVTRLETYSNMLIQTVSAEETADSMNALRAEITLKRLNMVQVAEVSVQQTASSSKITYETGADGGSRYGGYVYESYGGTQAACDVPEGTHIEALLWLAGQRGER